MHLWYLVNIVLVFSILVSPDNHHDRWIKMLKELRNLAIITIILSVIHKHIFTENNVNSTVTLLQNVCSVQFPQCHVQWQTKIQKKKKLRLEKPIWSEMTSFNQFYVQLLWYFHVYLLFVTLSTAQNGPNFRYDYSDDYAIARACRFKHNDTAGMCRQISDCPQVYVDWEQLNIVPTTCWYDRDVPVVCCLEVTEPQRPKQRISEKSE